MKGEGKYPILENKLEILLFLKMYFLYSTTNVSKQKWTIETIYILCWLNETGGL